MIFFSNNKELNRIKFLAIKKFNQLGNKKEQKRINKRMTK